MSGAELEGSPWARALTGGPELLADWEYPNGEGIGKLWSRALLGPEWISSRLTPRERQTHPGCNKRRPNDSANLLAFLKVLRAEIGRDRLITAAVSTAGLLGPDGKPFRSFAEFAPLVDYLNLMTVSLPAGPCTGAGRMVVPAPFLTPAHLLSDLFSER